MIPLLKSCVLWTHWLVTLSLTVSETMIKSALIAARLNQCRNHSGGDSVVLDNIVEIVSIFPHILRYRPPPVSLQRLDNIVEIVSIFPASISSETTQRETRLTKPTTATSMN